MIDVNELYGLKAHVKPTIRKPFIVRTARAHMPSNCLGPYGRVAVIETDGKTMPKMISLHAKGAVRIIDLTERCFVGSTLKSRFGVAAAYAVELCDFLNSLPVPKARSCATHDLILSFAESKKSLQNSKAS